MVKLDASPYANLSTDPTRGTGPKRLWLALADPCPPDGLIRCRVRSACEGKELVKTSDHDRPLLILPYDAVAKVRLDDSRGAAVLGLKETGLDVHFDDGEVLHFDLAGRLLRVARPNLQWRRGLSGRVLRLRRRTREEGGSLERMHVAAHEADELVATANGRMLAVYAALDAGQFAEHDRQHGGTWQPEVLRPIVTQAAAFDLQAANHDLSAFRTLYHDIPILPPDQYTSLVLLASDGCRYNKCTFCNFYRDVPYRARPLDLFREHVEQAVQYYGAALAARRHIFLGQANALMGPRVWRDEVLHYVNERFELPAPAAPHHQPQWWKGSPTRFTGITSFLDAFIGARISADEFAAMRQLNLRQIFIGMESGSSELLQWLRKPAEPHQMLETVRAAKSGGVAVGVIVLIGAGGERFFDVHVRDTVRLLRDMQLTAGDFIYLSPLVSAHGAEYDELAAAEGIEPLTQKRMAEQERQLRAGLGSSPTRQGPYVAHYEVEHFVF